jgi:hypothetical protein
MERGNRSYKNMKKRIDTGNPLNLNDQLNAIGKGLLPTPRAFDSTNAMPKEVTDTGRTIKSSSGRSGGISLNAYAQCFPTPKAQNAKGAAVHGEGGLDLQTYVTLWPTPRAIDSDHGGPNSRSSHGNYSLPGAVHHRNLWGTPTANDAKNSATDSQRGRGTLTAHIVEAETEIKGQLNPDWVEALMGYPQGWTDIEKSVLGTSDYPAKWIDGTWEDGIPRVATGVKNRANRLKCLGNAVVPQIPAYLWGLIKRALW